MTWVGSDQKLPTCGCGITVLPLPSKQSDAGSTPVVRSMKRVLVEWYDSMSYQRWRSQRELDAFVDEGMDVIKSVGFLYAKNKDLVVLIQSHHPQAGGDNFAEALMIPRACIKSIKKLK